MGGPIQHYSYHGALLLFATFIILAHPARAQKSGVTNSPTKQSAGTAKQAKPRKDVAQFRARVDAALNEAHAERAYWGVLVVDRDTGETLYDLNGDHFFTPASNAKVFVTALALETLGPAHRFRTTLESRGTLGGNGRLAGDLIFVGRGDPDISNRKFPYAGKVERDGPVDKILDEMVDAAISKGLKEVDGDIVADDSYFPYDPYPAGWSVGDEFFTFGAPVSAIAFNDNSISIEASPGGEAGEAASLKVDPGVAIDEFGHEIKTGPSSATPDFSVVRQPGKNFLLLRGLIPAGHTAVKLDLAMTDPAETTARALKQLLDTRGVHVTGEVRVHHAPPPITTASGDVPVVLAEEAPVPDSSSLVLAEHLSPPLVESIRVTNKVSQNLHAEMFLRAVAREKMGVGSTDAGIKVEQDFLNAAGIPEGDVVMSDGSGLSRDDLVTPRAVVGLLQYAMQQTWGSDFAFTFPVAGVDGTLENRMKNTAAAGVIEAKTGALEHVRSMSGYATTQRGEHLVFAIFGNNNPQRGRDATAALDEIGVAMIETLGAAPAKNPVKKKR